MMKSHSLRATVRPEWTLLILFAVQFTLLFNPTNLAWDGAFYYAYARSVACDGDLALENDLQLIYSVTPAHDFAAAGFEAQRTVTGRVDNPFAVGSALLWLPWLVPGCAATRTAWPEARATTGIGWPFVWTAAAVTWAYGCVAILVAHRLARRVAGRWAALLAAATVSLTTPLLYYQYREPFYAHAASAMATALFVAAWWHAAKRGSEGARAFLLGALGGLAALVRWQNAAYLVLPVFSAGHAVWRARRAGEPHAARHALGRAALTLAGAAIVFTLQMAVWMIFYGRPWIVPQGAGFIDWRAPWLSETVMSAFHGLLPWMPVTAPALVGLAVLARREPARALPLLVAFGLQVYVNSCVSDWFGGGGYGARRFSSALVVLAVGYAALVAALPRRYRLLAVASSGLLAAHQWLILRYGFANGIGGHVVSMGPVYAWHATSLARFVEQLLGYAPVALRAPLGALVMDGSPLHAARAAPTLLPRYALAAAAAAGPLALAWSAWKRIRRHVTPSRLAAALTLLVALANLWLLTRT